MRAAILLFTLLFTGSVALADDQVRPPSDGRALIVSGAILTALGGAMVTGSVALWATGAGKNPMGTALAASLDTFGGALLVPGIVLLPVGLVRRSRHTRWLEQTRVSGGPLITQGALGARASVAFSF